MFSSNKLMLDGKIIFSQLNLVSVVKDASIGASAANGCVNRPGVI